MSNREHRLRLCHLTQWPDYDGYGFNLHSEGGKPGQFIGKVDPDSPAQSAGLKEKDRIFEVNNVSVVDEKHREVVLRIKEGVLRDGVRHLQEVILLVADAETEEYYKKRSMPFTNNDPNILKLKTKSRTERDRKTSTEDYENLDSKPNSKQTQQKKTSSNSRERSDTGESSDEEPRKYQNQKPPERPNATPKMSNPESSTNRRLDSDSSRSTGRSDPSDIFNQSAAEFRRKLKENSAQRRNPQQFSQMGAKAKHDFVNGL